MMHTTALTNQYRSKISDKIRPIYDSLNSSNTELGFNQETTENKGLHQKYNISANKIQIDDSIVFNSTADTFHPIDSIESSQNS